MSVTFPFPFQKSLDFAVLGAEPPLSWVPLQEKQEFFSFPLGGARLSGIVVGEAALRASKGEAPSPSPAHGFRRSHRGPGSPQPRGPDPRLIQNLSSASYSVGTLGHILSFLSPHVNIERRK